MLLTDLHTHRFEPRSGEIIVSNIRFLLQEFPENTAENQFFSVGIHPWDAADVRESDFTALEKVCIDKRVRLMGECGLDKNRNIPYEKQLSVFQRQISISEKLQKPLIIHCVGYFNELFSLRNMLNPQQLWIIHGFRGKPQMATQALKLGFGFSFGEKYNPETVKMTPLNRLFIETDESEKALAIIYNEIATLKMVTPNQLTSGWQLLNC